MQQLVQQQRLVLNQRLVHGLCLLQLSRGDLKTEVLRAVQRNPLLEIRPSSARRTGKACYLSLGDRRERMRARDRFQQLLENQPDKQVDNIRAVLREQVFYQKHEAIVLDLACAFIQMLDDHGFFSISPAIFQNMCGSMPTALQEKIPQAIALIQRLEPQGCAVFNFKESLAVQARLRFERFSDPLYRCVINLLTHHSELLFCSDNMCDGRVSVHALTTQINSMGLCVQKVSSNDVKDILLLIKELHPFPGKCVSNAQRADTNMLLEPDVLITKTAHGFVTQINCTGIPTVVFRNDYCMHSKAAEKNHALKACMHDALSLVSMLSYRERTLLDIAKTIVHYQCGFFDHGPAKLTPLRMTDVAHRTGLSVSTVSRIVRDKWLQYGSQHFSLRYFFSPRVLSTEEYRDRSSLGQNYPSSPHSKVSVKHRISRLIQEVRTQRISLSDRRIAQLLGEQGIKCARRTVNKYLSELRTCSSS